MKNTIATSHKLVYFIFPNIPEGFLGAEQFMFMIYPTMSGHLLYLPEYLKTYGNMHAALNEDLVTINLLTSKGIGIKYSMHCGSIRANKFIKCLLKCRQVLIHKWINMISVSKRQHYITKLFITSYK